MEAMPTGTALLRAISSFYILALCISDVAKGDASRNDFFVGYREESRVKVEAGRLVLETEKGKIHILLMRNNAPHTTEAIVNLAASASKDANSRFYRNEDRPEQGSLGPPYGLLQGSLAALSTLPAREGNIVARRGHACMIPGTKEFFIALSDHSEWGTAHTVWGEVEDMTAVDRIVDAPFHVYKHPDHGTEMRMLNTEVHFDVKLAPLSVPDVKS